MKTTNTMRPDELRKNSSLLVSTVINLKKKSGSFLMLLMIAMPLIIKGQFATEFSNLSFYNATSGMEDLHYDYGWTRSSNNVTLQSAGMTLTSSSSLVLEHFTTVAYNLSGSDSIR